MLSAKDIDHSGRVLGWSHDVRYCGESGLSADVEFPCGFDPKRTWSAVERLAEVRLFDQRVASRYRS